MAPDTGAAAPKIRANFESVICGRFLSRDRGSEPAKITASYNNYITAVGQHRKAAFLDQVVKLDPGSDAEVTLKIIASNGSYKGGHVNAKDENDVSLSVLVSFDGFREEIDHAEKVKAAQALIEKWKEKKRREDWGGWVADV